MNYKYKSGLGIDYSIANNASGHCGVKTFAITLISVSSAVGFLCRSSFFSFSISCRFNIVKLVLGTAGMSLCVAILSPDLQCEDCFSA